MTFNDDEKIMKNQGNSTEEEDTDLDLDGEVEVRIISKEDAPMEETPFKVLLELKGVGSGEGRLGIDLVTVLDISGSMGGIKMEKMKLAMQFLVQKLGSVDRLSVVVFNRNAQRLCSLRQITEESRGEIADQVNALAARSSTNTEAGLKLALNILDGRSLTRKRRCAIMLMSDGIENDDSDSARVDVRNVPVYTFGFGTDCDPNVLKDTAKNGGLFSSVSNLDNLSVAFSTCLAGILSVVIDDLKLTIIPLSDSKFIEVNAGCYLQTKSNDTDAVTVEFGSLYNKETRKVLLYLTLPKVDRRKGDDVIKIVYEYRAGGKDTLKSHSEEIYLSRQTTSTEKECADQQVTSTGKELAEVVAEEKRLQAANSMKEARLLADIKKLEVARNKLVDSKSSLSEVDTILKAQLDQLHSFMASQETYDEQGRAFALSLEGSHANQRAASTGDAAQAGMFDTPVRELLKEQAILFHNDPRGYKPPTEEEDRKFSLDKTDRSLELIKYITESLKNKPWAGYFEK